MIYLDSNATTQVQPKVLEHMLPFLTDQCYNPSSGYRAGKAVRESIEIARSRLAKLIDADPDEIMFTGCGTESNNSALLSLASSVAEEKRVIVTSAIEHSAVLRVCENLDGFEVVTVGVDSGGRLNLEEWGKEVSSPEVAFATLMWSNNETGVIQPIAEACELAHQNGVPFHTDAIQAIGKTSVSVKAVPVDYLSISGHKFHAPKGVGALYVKKGLPFVPLLRGGGQEGGRRSGTENVASIVGMGCAAELLTEDFDEKLEFVRSLRDHLEHRLLTELEGVHVNGDLEYRSRNTAHLSFTGCEAAGLLILLDEYGVACSAGSACMTGKQRPSHVQKAMGFSDVYANSSLRISFSVLNTLEEVNLAVEAIIRAVKKLRMVQGGGVGSVMVYTS